MSISDLDILCKQEGRKFDNGTRRLRELMRIEPIKPIKNRAGAIIAYELVQEQNALFQINRYD